eukprot:4301935-Prymnesium_polylepis.1
MKNKKAWRVEAVDAETRLPRYVGLRKEWIDAVKLREKAQETEGTMGPGEVVYGDDGTAMAACGKCRKVCHLASFAPEPCMNKKAFD